jgi:hypothetical protein
MGGNCWIIVTSPGLNAAKVMAGPQLYIFSQTPLIIQPIMDAAVIPL